MNLLTDYALAVLTFALAHRLFKAARCHKQNSILFWSGAFFFSCLASALGGTYHGWGPIPEDFLQTLLWKGTVFSAGLASFFMLSGSITATFSPPLRHWVLGAASIKFLIYAGWMTHHNDFFYVICDYGGSMIIVLILHTIQMAHGARQSARWIMGGIGISFVAAGIQQSGMTIHPFFNHNDSYHVIQMGAFYLLYRGGLSLSDYFPPNP